MKLDRPRMVNACTSSTSSWYVHEGIDWSVSIREEKLYSTAAAAARLYTIQYSQ